MQGLRKSLLEPQLIYELATQKTWKVATCCSEVARVGLALEARLLSKLALEPLEEEI
jgi:hypothetical protein